MGLKENLLALMDAAGDNPNSLHVKTGVPQPTIYRICEGETTDPRRSTVERLAKHYGKTANDLYSKTLVRQTDGELPTPTDEEFSFVQQLDLRASCGNGRFDEHVVVKGGLAFKRSSLREFGVPENQARIIYADGTSMEPTIGHGRVVLVNLADTTPIDGKVYLICDPDGATYLKRLVRDYHPQIGGMAWIMRSDNPNKNDFPDKLLPDDARTTIVGRAVWNDNTL